MPELKLRPKQALFCLEYMKDGNGTQAAIRAGYSKKTAAEMGAENLRKPHIKLEIMRLKRELHTEIRKEVTVDAAWLLTRLHDEANADQGDLYDPDYPGVFKLVKDWPKIWRLGLVGDIEMGVVKLSDEFINADGETVIETRREMRPVKIKLSDRLKRLELMGKHKALKAFDTSQQHELTGDLATFFGAVKSTLGPPSER